MRNLAWLIAGVIVIVAVVWFIVLPFLSSEDTLISLRALSLV